MTRLLFDKKHTNGSWHNYKWHSIWTTSKKWRLSKPEQLSSTILGSRLDSFLLTHQSCTWFVQLAKLQMGCAVHSAISYHTCMCICIQCTFLWLLQLRLDLAWRRGKAWLRLHDYMLYTILWLALVYLGNHHDCNMPRLLLHCCRLWSHFTIINTKLAGGLRAICWDRKLCETTPQSGSMITHLQ